MNKLKVGFGRANVNPPMGSDISGYFIPRHAEGILDDLEVNALALECGDNRIILINIDNAGINQELLAKYRASISEATGVPAGNILIAATHTHTAPMLNKEDEQLATRFDLIDEYITFVGHKMVDVSAFALADLKDAKMGYGVGHAPNLAFLRRFLMKDGSIKTNPGVNNPDIVRPIGEVDERVNVLRFDREGAESIVLVNYGNHPDVVGGSKISGDWPAITRRIVENTLPGTKCIFFNGAQGDVNHVNVFPKGGDLNNMFIDFDNVARGYSHAIYMARVVTGGVMQCFDKVNYVDVDKINCIIKTIGIPSNMPDPKDVPEAIRINDLHLAGKDDEIPFEGMMLTTVVAEAGRMVALKDGPDKFDMYLTGVAIGPVGIIGIPGEPFSKIGIELKKTEGYDIVLPMCCANGYEGYFPMMDSYDEGGYESRSSYFKAGVAELIIEEGKTLLKEIGE